MSIPENLIRWPEAKALLAERGYAKEELFGAYKAGEFAAYSPHLHSEPMFYGRMGFDEIPAAQWFENWLWKEVQIDRGFVEKHWPERSITAGAADPSKRSGGRPGTYDWARLSAHVTAYLVENDYPPSQAELEREVRRWFENETKRTPDESTVRRWVKTLYDYRDVVKKR